MCETIYVTIILVRVPPLFYISYPYFHSGLVEHTPLELLLMALLLQAGLVWYHAVCTATDRWDSCSRQALCDTMQCILLLTVGTHAAGRPYVIPCSVYCYLQGDSCSMQALCDTMQCVPPLLHVLGSYELRRTPFQLLLVDGNPTNWYTFQNKHLYIGQSSSENGPNCLPYYYFYYYMPVRNITHTKWRAMMSLKTDLGNIDHEWQETFGTFFLWKQRNRVSVHSW